MDNIKNLLKWMPESKFDRIFRYSVVAYPIALLLGYVGFNLFYVTSSPVESISGIFTNLPYLLVHQIPILAVFILALILTLRQPEKIFGPVLFFVSYYFATAINLYWQGWFGIGFEFKFLPNVDELPFIGILQSDPFIGFGWNGFIGGIMYLLSAIGYQLSLTSLFILGIVAILRWREILASSSYSDLTKSSQISNLSDNEMSNPDSGWYPDPNGNPSERFWDGKVWTDETRPMMKTNQKRENQMSNYNDGSVSDKSWLAALLLCLFLGGFGIHRFFVGKIGTGILQLVTFGGLGIWWLIDFIMIITKSFTDSNGRKVSAN